MGGMCAPRPPFICHSSTGYRERRPFPEYPAWQMADGTRRDPEGERRQALHRWEASCSQERGDPRCLLAVPDTPVYSFSSASIFSWPCCFTEDRDSWEVAPSCVCSSHSGLAGAAACPSVDDLGCAKHREGRWPWANWQQGPWLCRASQHSILFPKPRKQMGRGMWKHLPHIHVTIGTWLGTGTAARLFDVAPGTHAYCVVLTVRLQKYSSASHSHTHNAQTHNTHMWAHYP